MENISSRSCQFCGTLFNSKRRDAKYCSDSCKVQASKARKAKTVSTLHDNSPTTHFSHPLSQKDVMKTTSPLTESISQIADMTLTNSTNSLVKNTLNAALVPLNDKITHTVRTSVKKSPLQSLLVIGGSLGLSLFVGKNLAEWIVKDSKNKNASQEEDKDLKRWIILGSAAFGAMGSYLWLESKNEQENIQEAKYLPLYQGLSDTHTIIPQTIPAPQLANFHVPVMKIENVLWSKFLGKELSYHARMLVYGKSGNGKTTFGFKLANYLQHIGKILFVVTEYGLEHSSLKELTQTFRLGQNVILGSARSVVEVFDLVRKERPAILIIDSFSQIGGNAEHLHTISQTVSLTVAMLHVTKDGEFAGSNQLAHDADIIVQVEDLEAKTIKNRFHPAEMIMSVRGANTEILEPVMIEQQKERSGLY